MPVKQILDFLERFVRAAVDPAEEVKIRWLPAAWLGVLLVLGGAAWGWFFDWGNFPVEFHDWAEVNAPRLAFVKDAVSHFRLPLHMPGDNDLRGLTDRYQSLPDVILTPQMVLLGFLSVQQFVMADILLLYLAGAAGLWMLRRQHGLSLLAFSALFLWFNFNGHVVCHLGVGHVTWGGYFLFPWLFYLVEKMLRGEKTWRVAAQAAGLLLVIFLQGSYHQFVWSLLLLGVTALAAWRHFVVLLKAMAFACLLSMLRILPAALMFGDYQNELYTGYPNLRYIFGSLRLFLSPSQSQPFETFAGYLGYWEFSLFLGNAGTLLFMLGILFWAYQSIRKREISPLLAPLAFFLIIAIGLNYQYVDALPIPLLHSERVPSRMAVMAFLILLFYGSAALQSTMNLLNLSRWAVPLGLSGLAAIVLSGRELLRFMQAWKPSQAISAFPFTPVDLAGRVVSNHADPPYFWALGIGLAASLLSALALWLLVKTEERKSAKIKERGLE